MFQPSRLKGPCGVNPAPYVAVETNLVRTKIADGGYVGEKLRPGAESLTNKKSKQLQLASVTSEYVILLCVFFNVAPLLFQWQKPSFGKKNMEVWSGLTFLWLLISVDVWHFFAEFADFWLFYDIAMIRWSKKLATHQNIQIPIRVTPNHVQCMFASPKNSNILRKGHWIRASQPDTHPRNKTLFTWWWP